MMTSHGEVRTELLVSADVIKAMEVPDEDLYLFTACGECERSVIPGELDLHLVMLSVDGHMELVTVLCCTCSTNKTIIEAWLEAPTDV